MWLSYAQHGQQSWYESAQKSNKRGAWSGNISALMTMLPGTTNVFPSCSRGAVILDIQQHPPGLSVHVAPGNGESESHSTWVEKGRPLSPVFRSFAARHALAITCCHEERSGKKCMEHAQRAAGVIWRSGTDHGVGVPRGRPWTALKDVVSVVPRLLAPWPFCRFGRQRSQALNSERKDSRTKCRPLEHAHTPIHNPTPSPPQTQKMSPKPQMLPVFHNPVL